MTDRDTVNRETEDSKTGQSLDRREFIKLLGSGIFVLSSLDAEEVLAGGGGARYPTDLNAYLKIGEDGKVTVYSGKIEMGQGVVTSLAQMAADELGVAVESIEMIMGDTDLCPPDSGTYGSMSTRFFGPALRTAAAEARAILIELASERLKLPKERLRVENGVVLADSDPKIRLAFGLLTRGQKITRTLSEQAVLKKVSEFTIMGKPIKRTDATVKVTGQAKYAGDIRVPGMLYARILRPPAHGAKMRSVDTAAAEKLSGLTVVNQDGMVAVLHPDPETAEKALAAVKADFDVPEPTVDNQTIFDFLLKNAPQPRENDVRGDLAAGEKAAASLFDEKYRTAYGAHAPIETHTALAHLEGGKMTVWISTQSPFPNRQQIARAIGFTEQNVRVITPFVGGGFGGKNPAQQAVEAAMLAKITGKPVQVAWTRAEEFFYDTFRPAAVVAIRSGIDNAGKICLWDYNVYFAGSRSSEQFYDVPNNIIRTYGGGMGGGPHPFAVGAWRAPGAPVNVFARESQIDIMAARAKTDRLDFRLNNTSDPRMRKVLQTVAERFGWKKAPAPSGRGLGIACGIDAETYCAEIAEVMVDRTSGQVRVRRIFCAQDMGTVINPDGATMQMEGCIMMGLGYTLSEDIIFRGGAIETANFDTYELPRFSQLPEIDTVLVKNDELTPKGGGEPAIVPVGAAVANAIFDATGARLFHFPMTPARIKEALGRI